MKITQICILMFLCFTGVLPNAINVLNRSETDTQPFIEIGGKYYLINTAVTMNWFAAALYCRNFDSDLAVIESQAEMNALSFYLTTNDGYIGKYFWLGVSDLADEGKFMSHTDGRPMPYAKWSGGQPDDAGNNEDCVHLWAINNVFQMNDNVCTAKAFPICELRQRSKSCDVCDLKHFMERFMQHTNAYNCQN